MRRGVAFTLADTWHSLISFTPGIPVAVDGTLELNFAADVNIASQIGRTIRIFDWAGVVPIGQFEVASPYAWDLSKLYSTGEIVLLSASVLPGDFNADGLVDAADYIYWRDSSGAQNGYDIWCANFGRTSNSGGSIAGPHPQQFSPNVPEPNAIGLTGLGLMGAFAFVRHRQRVS